MNLGTVIQDRYFGFKCVMGLGSPRVCSLTPPLTAVLLHSDLRVVDLGLAPTWPCPLKPIYYDPIWQDFGGRGRAEEDSRIQNPQVQQKQRMVKQLMHLELS